MHVSVDIPMRPVRVCSGGDFRSATMKRVLPTSIVLAMLFASGCASIHATMLGAPRPAVAVEQVRVFQVPPKRYEEIARLDASSAIGFGTQGQANAAINRLRHEAAKLGADGVLLLGVDTYAPPVSMGVGAGSYGYHGGASIGVGIPTAQKHAAGVAIHVIEE
jgi:hypothetical protein